MAHQNWNNLTRYIKRKLGVPLNFLELTDADIKEIIVEDVLPAFSQYIGRAVWIKIGPEHGVATMRDAQTPNADDTYVDNTDHNYFMAERYLIPIPEDMSIVDVQELYWPQYFAGNITDLSTQVLQSVGALSVDPTDLAITNVYADIAKSLSTVPTYRFIAPNELLLDTSLGGHHIIVECKVVHTELSTIPSDMYHEILKPWALAEILDAVIQMRKKYRTMATPFGEINLNWEELQTRYDTIMQTIQEKMDSLPPDILIAFT